MMSNDFWYGFLLGAGLVLFVAFMTIRLKKLAGRGK
jgi:hypothetical protein